MGNKMTKEERRALREEKWKRDGKVVKGESKGYVKPPVQAKNDVQKRFLKALKDKSCIVFEAPAGVGKSFLTMSEV